VSDFISFLKNLAPEGETFLLVRQKPIGTTLQYHADGAIKATWPAFLPDHKIKEGQSWYGNTASFIVERFEDGRVSASAANCEYILMMMLDDIGTKSKTPPLAPTWIMETSKGSFQWVYVFSVQPPKDDFAAAIRAIADAGYTDPGACNPVRNFRLPGSVNLKPGRDNFAAQLVEFHPEREYTLEEICAALDVVPGPVQSSYSPIRIADDGTDDVLAWLSNEGLLLTKPNAEGWAAVVCPNAAEHTDGNPEGRYKPLTRAYCCLHSHCVEFGSRLFLDWVAEQGGPDHAPGLREELLVSAMSSALAKLTPNDTYIDVAATIVAETERKELSRTEREDWYTRFAYIQDDDAYFDLQDRREVGRGTFNALFRHISCKSVNSGRKVEASVCFDENRQAKGALALVGITYAAGEDLICTRNSMPHGNRWRDARPDVSGVQGVNIDMWLNHVARMVPNEIEREHVLNVMAFKVQHANRKINHAVLHMGNPGAGKDLMWLPMQWALDGGKAIAVENIQNADIMSQWGYAYEREMIVFQELRQSEAKDRRALENHLKPIIAAPPEYLTVNRKGMHPYQALNRLFVLAFSNESIPLTLPSDDRRWFVVKSFVNRMPDADGKILVDWYEAGGFARIAAWLHTRDVAAFNPGAAPPVTEAKLILIDTGMSGAESFLAELMRARMGEFGCGAIGGPWQALCDRLTGLAPAGMKIPVNALMHAFREAEWLDMGLLKSRANTNKKHVFCAPELANKSKTELRDLVQGAGSNGALKLIKFPARQNAN